MTLFLQRAEHRGTPNQITPSTARSQPARWRSVATPSHLSVNMLVSLFEKSLFRPPFHPNHHARRDARHV
jgi:hypothetical protein